MDKSEFLSSTDVAKMLGLSVATVKRWVDSDILPAYKTAGGHRRFLPADVERLAKQKHLPWVDASSVQHKEGEADRNNLQSLSQSLYSALREYSLDRARRVVHGVYSRGVALEIMADQIIGPALSKIGEDWERGRIDVYQEHQATRVCESVLQELKAKVAANAQKKRPVAIGGSPEHDPTVVPNLLIELLLLENGWEVRNLGPHTPMASLANALFDIKPRLLWISMSHPVDRVNAFIAEYRELSKLAERLDVAIVIGGRAWQPGIRSQLTYTAFCDGLIQFAAFIRTINPKNKPRRRGRPSKKD